MLLTCLASASHGQRARSSIAQLKEYLCTRSQELSKETDFILRSGSVVGTTQPHGQDSVTDTTNPSSAFAAFVLTQHPAARFPAHRLKKCLLVDNNAAPRSRVVVCSLQKRLRPSLPDDAMLQSRRDMFIFALIGTASALLASAHPPKLLRTKFACAEDCIDEAVFSSNDLRPSRLQLQAEWQSLRERPAGREKTEVAFLEMLRARQIVGRADKLVIQGRYRDLDKVITVQLVHDIESAATILATSAVLSNDARRAIGFQWGACGWRHCGAQAETAMALSEFRIHYILSSTMERRYYLDIAKRALDEVLQLGIDEGFLPALPLDRSEYLSRETLEVILPPQPDPALARPLNAPEPIEEAAEKYEESLLQELKRLEKESGMEAD